MNQMPTNSVLISYANVETSLDWQLFAHADTHVVFGGSLDITPIRLGEIRASVVVALFILLRRNNPYTIDGLVVVRVHNWEDR